MQDINATIRFVEEQLQCRSSSSTSRSGVEKKSIKEISDKINNCVKIFSHLTDQEKAGVDIRKLMKDFNAIQKLEKENAHTQVTQNVSTVYQGATQSTPLRPKKHVTFEPEIEKALAEGRAPEKSGKKPLRTPLTKERELIHLLAHEINQRHFADKRSSEIRNFVKEAIETLIEYKPTGKISIYDILGELLAKADEMYAEEEKPAGEIFTERMMPAVQKEYDAFTRSGEKDPNYNYEEDPNYSYKDYDQRLLGLCVLYWKASRSAKIAAKEQLTRYASWQDCPLKRYPLGYKKLRKFQEQINEVMKSPQVQTLVDAWNAERGGAK